MAAAIDIAFHFVTTAAGVPVRDASLVGEYLWTVLAAELSCIEQLFDEPVLQKRVIVPIKRVATAWARVLALPPASEAGTAAQIVAIRALRCIIDNMLANCADKVRVEVIAGCFRRQLALGCGSELKLRDLAFKRTYEVVGWGKSHRTTRIAIKGRI